MSSLAPIGSSIGGLGPQHTVCGLTTSCLQIVEFPPLLAAVLAAQGPGPRTFRENKSNIIFSTIYMQIVVFLPWQLLAAVLAARGPSTHLERTT